MPRYDQHFLRSEAYAQRIVQAVSPCPDETLLEVGPGHGALTRFLLQLPSPYIGIEIDAHCLATLTRLPGAERATWINGDFLQVPLPEIPLLFVSNLPYSLSGPALFRILAHCTYIRAGVLMLQREVAARLYAPPRERPYGRLSVAFQSLYRVRRLFSVPPGAFSPPPKVWSEVVAFERAPQLDLKEWPSFLAFLRAAFRQPRQILRKNLAQFADQLPAPLHGQRPHQLSVSELIALWESLDKPFLAAHE